MSRRSEYSAWLALRREARKAEKYRTIYGTCVAARKRAESQGIPAHVIGWIAGALLVVLFIFL